MYDLAGVAPHRSWRKDSPLIHSAEILLHAHVWWSVPRPHSIHCCHALPFFYFYFFFMLPRFAYWPGTFPRLSLMDMLMFNMSRSAKTLFLLSTYPTKCGLGKLITNMFHKAAIEPHCYKLWIHWGCNTSQLTDSLGGVNPLYSLSSAGAAAVMSLCLNLISASANISK